MALELQDLRYFLEVKARGSLTAAARALGISQPSLSTAMQRLEQHLGTTLLLRERTGVTLTVTGRALAYDAEELVAIVARAERRVLGLEDSETGRFVIGCHESLGAYFLPTYLRAHYASHPSIDVAIHNASSASVRDATLERAVDFGIVVNPRPHPDLVLTELFEDAVDFFVLGDPQKRGRGAAPSLEAALARVAEGPLVHASRVSESQSLITDLEARGCTASRVIACGDFELVRSIALAGVGVALLPRRVASYGHEGKLVRLHAELPAFEDRIFLVYRADMHRTKASMLLKDSLVAHGRALRAAPRPSRPPPEKAPTSRRRPS
jgi:DNA-binding transcriptional LysR family regulator